MGGGIKSTIRMLPPYGIGGFGKSICPASARITTGSEPAFLIVTVPAASDDAPWVAIVNRLGVPSRY